MKNIRLTDGSKVLVRINMLTIKLMNDARIDKILKQIEILSKQKKKEQKIQDLQMKAVSKMLWVILRSNGRKVDEEDALMLMPTDPSQIEELFKEFQYQLESFKKKQMYKSRQ